MKIHHIFYENLDLRRIIKYVALPYSGTLWCGAFGSGWRCCEIENNRYQLELKFNFMIHEVWKGSQCGNPQGIVIIKGTTTFWGYVLILLEGYYYWIIVLSHFFVAPIFAQTQYLANLLMASMFWCISLLHFSSKHKHWSNFSSHWW